MSVSNPVLAYLHRNDVAFKRIEHESADSLQQAVLQAGIRPELVARAVLLGDEEGILLAVLPLANALNFSRLFELLQRQLEPVERAAAHHIFQGCELGTVPPLAIPFGIQAVIDETLLEQEIVYLEPGSKHLLVRLSGEDFRHLHRFSKHGAFSTPVRLLKGEEQEFLNSDNFARQHNIRQLRPVDGVKERLNSLHQLPPIGNLSAQLLQLYHDPDAGIEQLAEVIETDPSLSVQLLRHARSPFYGYPGEIETVDQAIRQVLGFDKAMNTALGISALRPFDIPREGPLGRDSLWRSALHCATLCQALCTLLPKQMEVNPGLAYLSGLLHNFGFLVLGHLLKPEYYLLNRVICANPEVPWTLIEKRTLGISHTQIGAELMRVWQMPDALQVTLREHHNESYQGACSTYPNLVLLANSLLKSQGIGDGADDVPPASVLNGLGITLDQANRVMEIHLQGIDDVDAVARIMAA
jgi:HD-like signal output (HDOD) protein/prolyl-tRNA editing enzyme YbaK/EbsC (Cys-tRNA(Pro) deacylase)